MFFIVRGFLILFDLSCMAGLVILLYHHFPILSCSKENVSELSRRKGKSFLSAPAFLSLKALAATKAESRLAGLREQLAKLVTWFLYQWTVYQRCAVFFTLSLSELEGEVSVPGKKVDTGLRKESASIEEAHGSCVEVSTPVTYYKINGLLPSFLS